MKQGSVNPFEEVKKRVDLLGLIEKWTGATARRSGKNYALSRCPFCGGHGCFSITPEKQLYHCFQCPGKAGGDVFDFLCKLRGCDKRASLEELAREAGYPLPFSRASGRDIGEAILSQAKEDWNLPQARDAWEYLTQERRLSPDVLKAHDVGYLGDRSRLIGILKKKGFTYEEIKNTGILTKGYGDFYEILFGWRASNGTLGGFIAGATKAGLKKLKPEEEEIYPKYKNAAGFQVDSPYNLYYAKRRVPGDATLVIVEGVLDCLQMLSHGLHNTIALGGTAFKEGYGKALEATRFERIILLLDSDRPGKQAASRLIPFLMRNHPKFALYVTEITAPDPNDETRTIKDPDELIVKLGAEVIRKVIGHPVKAGPWLVLAMRDQHDMKNPLDRDRIFQEVASLWGYVPDEVERKEILRYLADGSELPQEDIRKTIERLAQRALTIPTGGEWNLSEGKPGPVKEKAPSTETEPAELRQRADNLKVKNRDLAKKNKVLVQAYAAFVLQAKELSRSGLLWHVNRLAEGHVKLLKQLRRDPVKAQSMIGRINEIFEASRLNHLECIKGEIEALCKENDPDVGERAHAEAKGTESH
jgi:DNA primase catalytic core